jgi:hypothetical protein
MHFGNAKFNMQNKILANKFSFSRRLNRILAEKE